MADGIAGASQNMKYILTTLLMQFYNKMTMMRWTRKRRGGEVVVAMKQMLYTNDIVIMINFILSTPMKKKTIISSFA